LTNARALLATVFGASIAAACSSSSTAPPPESNVDTQATAPVCAGLVGSTIVDADFSPACEGLAPPDVFDCAEKRFWIALRSDYEGRPAAYAMLGDVIARTRSAGDPKAVANLYFRRGQLAMAMALEQKDSRKVFTVVPDFDEALALDPKHPVIPVWKDTLDMAFAALTKDGVKLAEVFERALANVPACPLGNIPSLTGTSIGAPLSSGIPQKTIALAETWKCEGVTWCTENTWKAPYAVAGMRYHFAEAYVRMGMKDRARTYLDAARAAPGYDAWPQKAFVEDKIANLDAFIASFTALGADEYVFDKVYANGDKGCVFCHGAR
jgi:hypothetical protein